MIKEDIYKAVDLLIKAKNIYVFGVGVSWLVAQNFYYKLNRINKRCIVHIDTHLQITSSVLMEKGDIAIDISYLVNTKEVKVCAKNSTLSIMIGGDRETFEELMYIFVNLRADIIYKGYEI